MGLDGLARPFSPCPDRPSPKNISSQIRQRRCPNGGNYAFTEPPRRAYVNFCHRTVRGFYR
jgi:hypothetical protein